LIHTEQSGELDRVLNRLRSLTDPYVNAWLPILDAESERVDGKKGPATGRLETELQNLDELRRAAAQYILASHPLVHVQDADRAILRLMEIPARWGHAQPGLAAACLFAAANHAQQSGHEDEAQIIRNELSDRFQNTYHGRLIKRSTSRKAKVKTPR
jgi:hypothetical protein